MKSHFIIYWLFSANTWNICIALDTSFADNELVSLETKLLKIQYEQDSP